MTTPFSTCGRIIQSALVERGLGYYSGKLGDAVLEERLLVIVDESRSAPSARMR
jgi:hypothetical protein